MTAKPGQRLPFLLGKLKTPRVLDRLQTTAERARDEAAEEVHDHSRETPPSRISAPRNRRQWVSSPELAKVWETPPAPNAGRRPRAVSRRAAEPFA
jgi:hypothetical protein